MPSQPGSGDQELARLFADRATAERLDHVHLLTWLPIYPPTLSDIAHGNRSLASPICVRTIAGGRLLIRGSTANGPTQATGDTMMTRSHSVLTWLVYPSMVVGVVAALIVGEAVAQQTEVAPQTKTSSEEKKETTKATVAVFTLYHQIVEAPIGEDPFSSGAGAESLNDLVTRIDKAGKDKHVVALAVILGESPLGAAQVEEVHKALRKVRQSGKPVYAFADSLSFRTLALLSAASRISVTPVGDLMITGLYGAQPHVRGLLEKMHVTPDFTTCGAYKSAAEMFMRRKPSAEAEEMYNWLFDSIFENYIQLIAEGRDRSPDQVRKWIDGGLYSAETAVQMGIIDAHEFRHDFIKYIKHEHGDDVEMKMDYGRKKKGSFDLSTPIGALRFWADILQRATASGGERSSVAIVYVEGSIVPGRPEPSPFGSQGVAYSDPIRKALDKAAEDDTVKAVVLRVNSPGGSAVASEIILQATRRVADKKPLIVSMGDVAGSGGYYVACGAETIFADPSTITASIGVVAGKLVTTGMWDSVGINWHPIKRGENADMMVGDEVFSSKQKQILQDWMNEVYVVFKGHVTHAHGDRLTKPLEEMAGGRVYTGQQALKLGLVDRLGSLDDAVRLAARQAKLTEDQYEIRVIPKPKNFLEQVLSDLSGGEEDQNRISLPATWQTAALWRAALPILAQMQPAQAVALRRCVLQLEVLQREGISLMTPEFVFE